MSSREYVCAYKYCLHHGEKVKKPDSVVINKKYYHRDCADIKTKIGECARIYAFECCEDSNKYPMAYSIIAVMVHKFLVPIEFIKKKLTNDNGYYKDKPVYALYGIRKIFWEKEMVNNIGSSREGTNQQGQGEIG